MAWRRIGNKPLSEPMLTRFTDAYAALGGDEFNCHVNHITVCRLKRLRLCAISHYSDVIMSAIASQITSLTIVYSTVYLSADQTKHQSSASLAFVWGIHRWWVNSPHKGPVTRKMFPFDDVIMVTKYLTRWIVGRVILRELYPSPPVHHGWL